MSYQVNWEIQALDQTAGFLRDDPIGVAALWDTLPWPSGDSDAGGGLLMARSRFSGMFWRRLPACLFTGRYVIVRVDASALP